MTDTPTPAPADLTPEVLARWEELAAKATEGPWSFRAGTPWGGEFVGNRPGDVMTDTRPPSTGIPFDPQQFGSPFIAQVQYQERDGEFIAAARTAVPALLSGVRSRDARIAELEAVIEEAPHENLCHSKYAIGFPSTERHECDCWKSRYTAGVDQ